MPLNPEKTQDIITALMLAEREDLIEFLHKLIKKAYPELEIDNDSDDDDLSWTSGSSVSEEELDIQEDENGLFSFK